MATIGFRTRDRVTGQVTVEIIDRITKISGTLFTGIAEGSVVIQGPASANYWFSNIDPASSADTTKPPLIQRSGATVSWSWPEGGPRRGVTILYGSH